MLSPRLTDCPECANIPNLLKEIDCRLAYYANGLYNNITFMLNQSVPAGIMIQLIAYKRILTYKNYNPNYISDISINRIASKVKLLTLGCVSDPICAPCTTTTSSTSTSSTTTTTTTLAPTTTTTSSTTGIITTVFPYTYNLYLCNDCTTVQSSGSKNNSETVFNGAWYPWSDPAYKVLITSITPGYNEGIANTSLNVAYFKNTCAEITCL